MAPHGARGRVGLPRWTRTSERRTSEGRDEAYGLRLEGVANRKRLIAWRRESGLCAKCGSAIRPDQAEFKHCERCRDAFSLQQRRYNARLTERQRLARNARTSRKSYWRCAHGKPLHRPRWLRPPPPLVTEAVTRPGPKRDRAEYMRLYRSKAKS